MFQKTKVIRDLVRKMVEKFKSLSNWGPSHHDRPYFYNQAVMEFGFDPVGDARMRAFYLDMNR